MNNTTIERLIVVESHNNASEITDAIQGYKVELVFMDSDDAIAFVRRATNRRAIVTSTRGVLRTVSFPITCVINKRRDKSQQTLEIVDQTEQKENNDSQSKDDLQYQQPQFV